jgi:hypothetical protein
MRAHDRVESTRRSLVATFVLRAILWGAASGLAAVGLLTALANRRGGALSPSIGLAAGLVAIAVAVTLLRPVRRLTVPRVALWIEERVPKLQYALVTAVDPAGDIDHALPALERQIESVSWAGETRRAAALAVRGPVVAVVSGVVLIVLAARVPAVAATSVDGTPTGTSTTAAVPRTSPFASLAATVRAPAYAGGKSVRIESPASITALVGSAVTLDAPGSGDGISIDVGDARGTVLGANGRWTVTFAVGSKPTLVRLRHSSGERLIALEPRSDSVPSVRLLAPLRDTVMRVARGSMTLSAEVHDDIALVSGGFEYILSSGEGESFKFSSGTLGVKAFASATNGSLAGSLSLESLKLKPGDLVHIRAVARDGNNVSGPGKGSSETRVVRVARSGEYDSIAVEGAPPPEADKSLISQRMLIILTEALEKRRPRLTRETLVSESRTISRDQTRLRKRVGDIIFQRLGDDPSGEHGHGPDEEQPAGGADSTKPKLDSIIVDSAGRAARRAGRSAREIAAADSADSSRAALLRAASAATGTGNEILDFEGDETPVVAINRPLLEAYNAMWEASRELDQGETGKALPPMRRALEAIQRARQAERIYLRGKAPAVVVDLARVRLTGKEGGEANRRAPRAALDPAAARRAERLSDAIALGSTSPAAAIDSLVLLRVESLEAAPALADAIGDAIDAMRANRDASGLLSLARRVAEGGVRSTKGVGAWSGVW